MSSPAHARLGFRRISATALVAIALAVVPKHAMADQGGVSFWLPGQYGSLAAAPQQPGWMLGTVYYHTSVEASANVSAAREIQIGKLSPTLSANLNANLDAKADLALFAPSYVFASPVLGGQLAVGFTAIYGRTSTSVDATLNATLGPLGFTRSGGISDAATGFGDLYPLASLRWNAGVHNFMTYMTGGIPVGNYDSTRLSNIGIGHGAIDGGVGYTYFDPQKGHEFSFVTGLTHNFRNPDTDYRNGANWHLDWGASQFLSKQVHVGLVGYFYNQLTADSGQPAILGDFKSRVSGIGPQIGFIFPFGDMQGYLNFKGYKEFDAANRPEGWNAWVTFAISPAAPGLPPQSAQSKSMIAK